MPVPSSYEPGGPLKEGIVMVEATRIGATGDAAVSAAHPTNGSYDD